MNRFSLPSVSRYYAARRQRARGPRKAAPWGPRRDEGDLEERPRLATEDEGDRE